MTRKRPNSSKIDPGSYEEVVRLLAVLAKRGVKQRTLIYELNDLGFKPKRIAALVGTTGNTVNVALSTRRRKSSRRATAQREKSPEEEQLSE